MTFSNGSKADETTPAIDVGVGDLIVLARSTPTAVAVKRVVAARTTFIGHTIRRLTLADAVTGAQGVVDFAADSPVRVVKPVDIDRFATRSGVVYMVHGLAHA